MRVRVSGFRELDQRLARLEAALPEERVRKALHDGAQVLVDEMRRLAPVDTGRLRDSIQAVDDRDARVYGKVSAGDVSVYVGPVGSTEDGDVFYARFIEFGTSRRAAEPFLRPALAARREQAEERVLADLSRAIEDASR